MALIKIGLSRQLTPKNPNIKYDQSKLNDPRIQTRFKARIGWKFAPLLLLNDHQETIEAFTVGINEAAEKCWEGLDVTKQPWITEEMLELGDRRRELNMSHDSVLVCINIRL